MPNLPILRQVLDDIRDEVFNHDQAVYFNDERTPFGDYAGGPDDNLAPPCGTAMCIAGWTAWRSGWRPVRGSTVRWERDGDIGDVEVIARQALGLGHEQSASLFSSEATVKDLEEMYVALGGGQDITNWDFTNWDYDDGEA